MSKHTPAPWYSNEENCGGGLNVQDKRGHHIAHTAVVYDKGKEMIFTDEAFANARLISAAPELLDALQSLMIAYGAADGRNGNSGECWDKARAAIRKATRKPVPA